MANVIFVMVSTILLEVVCSGTMHSRVVGGNDAILKQFPYQISLRRDHMHVCGGSVISNRHVLTAAHCVVVEGTESYSAERFTIRAGTTNRIAGGIIVPVKRILVHPDYKVYNDLAILELKQDLVLSDTVHPIDLFEGEVPENADIIISGWGLIEHGEANLPIYLQYNNVTALSKTNCARKIGLYTEALICLNHQKGAGACNGDSGGPATYNGKLVGVAGFVVIKCASSKPDGYAKVAYNIDWIRKNMT